MNKNRMLRLLRRARARTGPEDHEADAAAALLERICDQHGITVNTVVGWDSGYESDDGNIDVQEFTIGGAMWRASLAWSLADYTNTYVLRVGKGKRAKVRVIGVPTDVDRFRALYNRLQQEIEYDSRTYVAQLPAYYTTGDKRRAGDSYRKGEVRGISDRIASLGESDSDQRAANEAALARAGRTNVTALVLRRAEDAKDYAENTWNIKKSRPVRASDYDAYHKGRKTGSNRSLHRADLT